VKTTFTQGSARSEITLGSFTWDRKMGKKSYAYVANDECAVDSKSVMIAAN
jgi:hypothetical protein